MTNEQLAVVIVSWNVCDLLARCLEALFADLDAASIDARVIVVDNASVDGSPAMIRERFPRVESIVSETNLGFAGGNNLGLRTLGLPHPLALSPNDETDAIRRRWEGEAVLLLNPDTEVQPGAIKTMLAVMQSRPEVAVVTTRLVYGDGSFQHSAFHFPGLAQLYIDLFPVPARLYESRLNGRYPRSMYDAGQPFEIDHPLGAVMLLRTAAIRQVGLFDEHFALYCEEIDWCARFKEAGWKLACAPAAQVIHHAGKSTSQVQVESFVKLWTARYRLHTKHPHFAPMRLARWIVTFGMKRRMKGASDEMRAACHQIMDIWHGK
jgi:N-acetylglucosaminyl-diphospho-decaprenol L-rhamnosyltransferase